MTRGRRTTPHSQHKPGAYTYLRHLVQAAAGAVVLDAAGQLHVAERQVTLDELEAMLERVSNREAAHVLLAADEAVPHGFVVDVMDLIRRLRIERLSIETVREARR